MQTPHLLFADPQLAVMRILQAHTQDSSLTVAKLGLAQIDLLKGERTNAITLLEGTLQEVTGWLDALKVLPPGKSCISRSSCQR